MKKNDTSDSQWLHVGGDSALEMHGMCWCECGGQTLFAEAVTSSSTSFADERHVVVAQLFDIPDEEKSAFYSETVRQIESGTHKNERILGCSIPERALIESFYEILRGVDRFKLQKRFDPADMEFQGDILKKLLDRCTDTRTVRLVLEFLINYPVSSVDLEDLLFDENYCLYYGEKPLRKLTMREWDFYDGFWPVLLTEGE